MRSGIVLRLLLISAIFDRGTPVVRSGIAFKWSQFVNKVILSNIIDVAENIGSHTQCVLLCLENRACVSVFYRQMSRSCQFHDVLFLSPQDGMNEIGTEYSSLTTGPCPAGYINNRPLRLCFKQHLNKIPYDNCVADCLSRGEHLIVIDSQEKQDFVTRQITSSSGGILYSYFIDGSDAVTEGQWFYHDGQPITFFAWNPGYPRNSSVDGDYIVASKVNAAFLWQDRKKAETKYYMCETDVMSLD